MVPPTEDEDTPHKTFLTGISMGLADIVPGVSGGTIALIAGIYERLILAIKTINLTFIPYLFFSLLDRNYLEKAKKRFTSIDFKFLIPLGTGIGLAFLIAAFVITFLLDNYPAFIYSFFFGLILMSAKNVYKRIKGPKPKTFVFSLIGFLFAFFFVGLSGVNMGHTLPILFISGFLAICAMLLPGISGSFIVLFLGQYEYMLEVLKSIQALWIEALVFIAGGFVSLVTFSRAVSRLLSDYHAPTLFFLSGLMVGALRLPLEKIIKIPEISQDPFVLLGAVLSGLLGIFLIHIASLNDYSR